MTAQGALDAAQKRVSELESAPELLVTKGWKGECIRYRDLERVELAGTSLVQSEVIFNDFSLDPYCLV